MKRHRHKHAEILSAHVRGTPFNEFFLDAGRDEEIEFSKEKEGVGK